MAQYITVKNKAHLDALQNHEQGEIAYCVDTKDIWVYDEKQGWVKSQIENKGIDLNLYDLNKSIVAQLEPMTAEEINEKLNQYDKINVGLEIGFANIKSISLCSNDLLI